ncbi:MAG: ASCH domain-containing protein [Bacilli bacterium]|nr:ASCH domain-containing protein [Bacilli bacterium]
MEMIFHLDSDIFDIVSSGSKDVEIRLNDEKRRKLNIGDTLVFLKRPDDIESIKATITNLVYFNNFLEVVNYYDMKRIYLDNTSSEDYINLMKRFYNDEEVEKYGVVAIEFNKS